MEQGVSTHVDLIAGPYSVLICAASKSSQEVTIASGLKKRAISNRFSRFQKSTIRKVVASSQVELRNKPQAGQANGQEETPLYENYQQFDTIGEETEL